MRVALFAVIALALAGQTPAPAPAIYKTAAELTSALQQSGQTGGMLTSAVSNTDDHRINLVKRTTPGGAVAHPEGSEVHHIVEGTGTLVTGGTLVRSTGAGTTATIQGGEARRVSAGDVIFIPAGTPHWYRDIDGAIAYLEVRFNTPAK